MNRTRMFIIVVGMTLMMSAVQSAFAQPNPRNCLDILQTAYLNGTSAPDGDYVIEPVLGKPFPVYCKNMSTFSWNPQEYLTLVNTGGDYNFSQFTVGGWVYGTTIRTNYTKLRIDPSTTMIDISDTTFATTTGELGSGGGTPATNPVSYGAALDCNTTNSQTGLANIDLTGTPFVVNDEFYVNGWNGAGSVSFGGPTMPLKDNLPGVLVTGKVVNITGGGYCGGTGPRGHNSYWNTWNGASAATLALQLKWVP